jgi:hypothetical protein
MEGEKAQGRLTGWKDRVKKQKVTSEPWRSLERLDLPYETYLLARLRTLKKVT